MPNAPHNPDNPAAPGPAEREAIVQDNMLQPDPELRLSEGRATTTQITITTIAALVILFVVFYGLNNQRPETAQAPAESSQTASGGTATPQPAAGGQANAQAPAANNQENTGSAQNGNQAKEQPGATSPSKAQAQPPAGGRSDSETGNVGSVTPATQSGKGSGARATGGAQK